MRGVMDIRFRILLLSICTILFLHPAATLSTEPKTSGITVADDSSYPPFAFLDEKGNPRGITIDIWKLWSEKTGIPVTFKLMPWDEALHAVENGDADAIGGLFKESGREKRFDFSTQILEIKTSLFIHRQITGIKDYRDLAGFQVGLVEGDAAVNRLEKDAPLASKKTYASTEELVKAAVQGEIRILIADEAVVLYYLNKMRSEKEFKISPMSQSINRQYAAVRKGETEKLLLLNSGFERIQPQEIQDIVTSWTGIDPYKRLPWRWIILSIMAFCSLGIVIAAWNFSLRKKVRLATIDLIKKNAELEESRNSSRRNEQMLKAVFDQIHHLFGILRTDGTIVDVNRHSLELIGKKREEVINKHIWETDWWNFSEQSQTTLREAVSKAALGEFIKMDVDNFLGDHGLRKVDFSLKPVRDQNQEVIFIVAQGIDLTERKALESQLQHAQKMDAIGQLAGGVAHDFNNQLSAISGFAELISYSTKEEETEKNAKLIIEAAQRSAELTRQLLTFSRKKDFKTNPVDINQIMNETILLLQRSLNKNIRIETRFEDPSMIILGDATLLQNALLNIAINARDAMPQGGWILFSSSKKMLDEFFCRSFSQQILPGPYAVVSIEDNGLGMDSDTLKRIYDPFFTTKPQGKGTGLGLTAVYGTVKSHKGTIECYSEPGRGTRFTLYLPCSQTPELISPTPSLSPPVRGIKQASILFIDDEPLVQTLGYEMLKYLGFNVHLFSSAKEALGYYTKHWKNIDLVILDMIMPEMGGIELFNHLRQVNPEIRSILLSGYAFNDSIQNGLENGITDYLQKPFSLSDLQSKVDKTLKK